MWTYYSNPKGFGLLTLILRILAGGFRLLAEIRRRFYKIDSARHSFTPSLHPRGAFR
jgi:hypothetical protein